MICPGDFDKAYGKLCEVNPDALVCKGFETAYLGHTVNARPVAVYDYEMCLDIIIGDGDITRDEAIVYFLHSTLVYCTTSDSPLFMRSLT